MLVLSRKQNESVIISDNIILTVIEIRGDKVRLGIEAPKDIHIHRQEIYDKVNRRQQSSTPTEATPRTHVGPAQS